MSSGGSSALLSPARTGVLRMWVRRPIVVKAGNIRQWVRGAERSSWPGRVHGRHKLKSAGRRASSWLQAWGPLQEP